MKERVLDKVELENCTGGNPYILFAAAVFIGEMQANFDDNWQGAKDAFSQAFEAGRTIASGNKK